MHKAAMLSAVLKAGNRDLGLSFSECQSIEQNRAIILHLFARGIIMTLQIV